MQHHNQYHAHRLQPNDDGDHEQCGQQNVQHLHGIP